MSRPDSAGGPDEPGQERGRPFGAAPEGDPASSDAEELPSVPLRDAHDPGPAAREGPPGGRVFSLEGRRAPGLYLVAWVLSVAGLAFFFVLGPLASSPTASLLLISLGAVSLTVGLAAACGYQIVERRDRHPERYRGPSPLLVFFAYFFALTLLGLIAFGALDLDPQSPVGFLVAGLVQTIGYAAAVWLFVVRSGAMTWRDMGWPTWHGGRARELLRSIGTAVGVVLPATFGVLILGGLLATILGVEAPNVLPTPSDQVEAFMVVLVASILAPVGEELFFRGFALTAWGRDVGARSALIRSSVFFALIHIANITTGSFSEGAAQALLQTAVILPLAFVLGWLFIRHGMAAAIAGHLTYNSLLLLLLLLSTYLPETPAV